MVIEPQYCLGLTSFRVLLVSVSKTPKQHRLLKLYLLFVSCVLLLSSLLDII